MWWDWPKITPKVSRNQSCSRTWELWGAPHPVSGGCGGKGWAWNEMRGLAWPGHPVGGILSLQPCCGQKRASLPSLGAGLAADAPGHKGQLLLGEPWGTSGWRKCSWEGQQVKAAASQETPRPSLLLSGALALLHPSQSRQTLRFHKQTPTSTAGSDPAILWLRKQPRIPQSTEQKEEPEHPTAQGPPGLCLQV